MAPGHTAGRGTGTEPTAQGLVPDQDGNQGRGGGQRRAGREGGTEAASGAPL